MSSRATVDNINPTILRQCREQMGLSLDDVRKTVASIEKIENGDKKPSFNQIDQLAELYLVPRWVFIADNLPQEYQFDQSIPAFRQFKDSNHDVFSHYKVRALVTRLERMREFAIELRDDMDEPIAPFKTPLGNSIKHSSVELVAHHVRQWLGVGDDKHLKFDDWRNKIEQKNIFVFKTNSMSNWSTIRLDEFRGFALYHSIFPVIVINGSDWKKAKSFTLFHELGHVMRKQNAMDDWNADGDIERWCDELAGCVLIPRKSLERQGLLSISIENIDQIEIEAQKFHVSSYAFLVRLRQLNIIDKKQYFNFKEQMRKIYEEKKEELERLKKEEKAPKIPRSIPNEVFQQYGSVYLKAVFQSYYDKEIGLHRLCQLLGIKRFSYIKNIEEKL